MAKYCHVCKAAESRLKTEEERRLWKAAHEKDCSLNHEGSSKAMEQAAAVTLWNRSIEMHNRYTSILSDGDSTAHKAVLQSQPYEEEVVVSKLECINHAHKRMGTALRKLAKEEHLGGRGKGALTEKKCDALQNFYCGAILDNLGDVETTQECHMGVTIPFCFNRSETNASLLQEGMVLLPRGTIGR